LGGEDDNLQTVRKELKQLEKKETVNAIIQNLGFTVSIGEKVAGISSTLDNMILDPKDEKVLLWLIC